jgi:hypothetical protein
MGVQGVRYFDRCTRGGKELPCGDADPFVATARDQTFDFYASPDHRFHINYTRNVLPGGPQVVVERWYVLPADADVATRNHTCMNSASGLRSIPPGEDTWYTLSDPYLTGVANMRPAVAPRLRVSRPASNPAEPTTNEAAATPRGRSATGGRATPTEAAPEPTAPTKATVRAGGTHDPVERPGTAIREDDRPMSPVGSRPDRRKSHIGDDGSLRPANPKGTTTLRQHVHGGEPPKSLSPYTSFKTNQTSGKVYGTNRIVLDLRRLRKDMAAGKVQGVRILEHEEVVQTIEVDVAKARARYEARQTPENASRLQKAEGDLAHAQRDEEILVKGVIPGKYFEVQSPATGE